VTARSAIQGSADAPARPTVAYKPVSFATTAELDKRLPVSIGISGASGSGKTYSALEVVTGLAEGVAGKGAPIAFVDTENRRGLHYREEFPQMLGHYVDFGPFDAAGALVGYPPERWIAMLDMVEKSGVTAMVIDSFSHSWEGIGGVLEMHAKELERLAGGDEARAERVNFLAWAPVKPRYRRLINRIVRSPVNVVICTRAKKVPQKWDAAAGAYVNVWETRTRRPDVPWNPAIDEALIYEMTVMVILDPAQPGCPRYAVKCADGFKRLFRADAPLGADVGRAMAAWSKGQGTGREEKALMDLARASARAGRAAFLAFWQALDKPRRSIVAPILGECEELAAAALAMAVEADDPFLARGAEPPAAAAQPAPAAAGPPARRARTTQRAAA